MLLRLQLFQFIPLSIKMGFDYLQPKKLLKVLIYTFLDYYIILFTKITKS
ncbi:hypothetical protein Anacy_3970 [Anabaena cylindrica PCC 7122]|uniref:Uncharacterized protein n=1 Tax=Anabaena cylindrica (strain ATCC 27899 / PCC 7122) TaxID=272123 RepID=K9ZJG4_ANACC|nr:hypothetical protein Anacy_3970 [Anabaena cylindrica PCC 7122]BAY03621.1 hypothetical protein NIES19_28750 [Anabaena cylindrica PCC 7122]